MPEDSSNVLVLEVPARQVTLLEDRARVVRQGRVELPAGVVRVRVADVAAVLSDKTLTGAVLAEDGTQTGARVVDARVVREYRIENSDHGEDGEDAASALERELRELDAHLRTLESDRVIVERHATGLDKLTVTTMTELSEDVSYGRPITDDWRERLTELSTAERQLREQLVDIASEIADQRKQRQRLSERIARTQKPAEREWAAIEADLLIDAAGAYQMTFEYVVPNACWRPYHTARLDETTGAADADADADAGARTGTVVFTTDACIWQNTGEDWRDVQLILSTERASLGTEPPPLASDTLRVQRKSDNVVVETREQEIQTLGAGVDESRTLVSPEVPGIDDGGEAINLRADKPATVISDGRPHRVPLVSFASPTTIHLVAMPELMTYVLTKTVLGNKGAGPILAGPVDLIRGSGLVGRTSVLFIAAGERFELGWGPEPDLRIKRTTERTEEKSRMLSSWTTRIQDIEIRVSNLGDRQHAVQVTERVPVSEIDKVKIAVASDGTTGGQKPDDNGLVTWNIVLGSGDHERVQLRYKLERHEDVYGI